MKFDFYKKYFIKLVVFCFLLVGGFILSGGEAKAIYKCDWIYETKNVSAINLTDTGSRKVCQDQYGGQWTNSGGGKSTCLLKGRTCFKSNYTDCKKDWEDGFKDAFKSQITGPLAPGTVKITSFTCTDSSKTSASTQSTSKTKVAGQLGAKGTIGGFIPDCTYLPSKCRDVSIFVVTLIGITRYLFSVVGALFLIMFIYGGIVWITSQGNSEKLKKGLDIFVAAVLGLVVVFSAYMLVNYLGEALQIKDTLKI